MREKRRYHRMDVEIPVSFEAGDSKWLVIASTLDISATGLSMKLNEPVAVGQILNLTVGLDEHRMVKVSSQVMWVKERRQGDKKVYHIGVKIIDKMDQDEIDFVRFVAGKMMECFRDSEERGGSDEISVAE